MMEVLDAIPFHTQKAITEIQLDIESNNNIWQVS